MTNPLDEPRHDKLTFDDLTWLVFSCVVAVCVIVVFGLGLWAAAQDLEWLI